MNHQLPAFSSADLIRALLRLGFIIKTGGKGSHVKLIRPGFPGALTIPKQSTIRKGLRSAIIKQLAQLKVSQEDLLREL